MSHVFLYGPPGTGKSTVGRALAELMGSAFVDLDQEIEAAEGRSVAELFADGEDAFRAAESAALERVVGRAASVVALGGGALLREQNRRIAEDAGRVVCLDADEVVLRARLAADAMVRPLLAEGAADLADLLAQRRTHYRSFSIRVRLADGDTPAQTAQRVVARLDVRHVRTPDGRGYDVVVRAGALDTLGALLQERDLRGPVAVVADDTVAALYAERAAAALRSAGYETVSLTFPAGETSKTLDTVTRLWAAMLEAGLDRTSTVVALGGGVTGDLAGFAAATFMRGVSWVVVPTSVVAMVDASIGGKTGVDLAGGKNLAGCFHHPRLVVTDPDLLATLPEPELRAGLAEVVKHGVIGDPTLFAILERGWEEVRHRLGEIVERALAVKIPVVVADPHEQGARAVLNAGHTVGHALEVTSGFTLRHGEAVAIGLVAEAAVAERIGLASAGTAERIGTVLTNLGLPVEIPDRLTLGEVVRAMATDKKRTAGTVRFSLPVAVGDVRVGVTVPDIVQRLASSTAPA